MAGRSRLERLEACKTAAISYRSRLQHAATRDEALDLALEAAENLMQGIELSSTLEEKTQFRVQTADIMDVAARIKNSTSWTPSGTQVQAGTKNGQIGQWAEDVAITRGPEAAAFKRATSPSGSSRHNLSSATAPVENTCIPPCNPPTSLRTNAPNAGSFSESASSMKSGDTPPVLVDLLDGRKASSSRNATIPMGAKTSILRSPASETRKIVEKAEVSSTSPSIAPFSQIHRLVEPRSTRKRSKKEDIILLKASVVNGFKCPPWDKPPSSDEFLANEGIELFSDIRVLSLSPYQQQFFQGWVRAKEAIPPPSLLPGDRSGIGPSMSSPHSIDLVQDAASDCSVVASLCAGVARAERGHDQILSNILYPFDKQLGRPVLTSNGKYIIRLNFNGCWRKVVIDDRLPVSNTHRILHVIDRRNPALLWPPLLEKAYLKIRGGYDFPGSNSCSDLWTLTGWIPEQVFLQETDTVPDQLWSRIYKAFLYGDVLITAGTGRMSSRQERELGLEGQHSYAVLDMKETDLDRLLLIKNPWLEGKEWCGPRPSAAVSMNSSTQSDDTKNRVESYHRDSVLTQDRPHPTTFWVGLEQVIRHFESLYLNWNPGLFRHREDIHFEWNVDSKSPDGCIIKHPQFAFASKAAGTVWFILSRHFRDNLVDAKEESDTFNDGSLQSESLVNASGEPPKGYMGIYICNGHGERLYIKDTYLESSDYVTTPQCLLRWDDADANTNYTIVIDQDGLPSSLYSFSLSTFSNSAMTLELAAPRYPMQRLEEGAWTRQSAGGGTGSSRYFENPQYSLEVRHHGSLAMLLTSTNHEHPLHVKLALGHGKRIYRLQSRDVLADSGNHRSGCVFAEIKDLQPGLYTVICSLFEAGQTGDYALRVDSTSDVVLKKIPRDGAGLLSMKLSPACFGANIHKVAAPLLPHRLASYTIIARFLRATSPRSLDLGKLARSPLRLSVEMGRGPERKFIIASERGEYADSATVRSESVNIEPALSSQGDLWLVLDRLSGPGGPIEEWYDVEIYTDVPQACSVGVWREWDGW